VFRVELGVGERGVVGFECLGLSWASGAMESIMDY